MKSVPYSLVCTLLVLVSSSAYCRDSDDPAALVNKVYHIPAPFLIPLPVEHKGPSITMIDAEGVFEKRQPPSLEALLKSMNLTLPTGGEFTYDRDRGTLGLTADNTTHARLATHFDKVASDSEKQLYTIVEFIEVEHMDFSDWLLSNRLSGDATALRHEVQDWLRDKDGQILETALIVARSGQRAKAESISEVVYPTETTPIGLPNTLTLSDDAELPQTSLYGSAYEARNVGTTVEVDPVLGADGSTIDLNLAPEMVSLEGYTEWFNEEMDPNLRTRMPTFYAMKATTQVTLTDGRYALLASTRPMKDEDSDRDDALVLIFVRVDISNAADWWIEKE